MLEIYKSYIWTAWSDTLTFFANVQSWYGTGLLAHVEEVVAVVVVSWLFKIKIQREPRKQRLTVTWKEKEQFRKSRFHESDPFIYLTYYVHDIQSMTYLLFQRNVPISEPFLYFDFVTNLELWHSGFGLKADHRLMADCLFWSSTFLWFMTSDIYYCRKRLQTAHQPSQHTCFWQFRIHGSILYTIDPYI